MSSVYDPNGGTLHDLAAQLTRWAVGQDDIIESYDMVMFLVDVANRETGKSVPARAIGHDALMMFPDEFTRKNIQHMYNLVRRYYR